MEKYVRPSFEVIDFVPEHPFLYGPSSNVDVPIDYDINVDDSDK